MIDKDTKPWLPENYQRFTHVSKSLDQLFIFTRWLLGRRLYKEQQELAENIAQQEGWLINNPSDDFLIKRVKATVTLAGEISRPITPAQTSDYRIEAFDSKLRSVQRDFRYEENRENTVGSIARIALNFSGSYWESQDTEYAERMSAAIKNRRAGLSREAHMGFQSSQTHWQ